MNGIYVLIIQLNETQSIKIGALGELTFPKGIYAYIGSAQNNLELRVKRHQRKAKRLFWHIDYLLNNPEAKIKKILIKESDKTEECKIADMLKLRAKSIARFGSSDCRCESHLFIDSQFDFLQTEMKKLELEE